MSAIDYDEIMTGYADASLEQTEWRTEWNRISQNLIPGRGIYNDSGRPRKRKLTNTKIINPIAEESLYNLVGELHSRLTSPSRPWFDLSWADTKLADIEPLKNWLGDCMLLLHEALHVSNFYTMITPFYLEYAGFGNGVYFVAEEEGDAPFRFELLTAGEYYFATDSVHRVNRMYRDIVMTPRQAVERFGDQVSKDLRRRVENNEAGTDQRYLNVLEAIVPHKYQDKPYTQVFYDVTSNGGSTGSGSRASRNADEPLGVAGFYEFPVMAGRWETVGSDIYGIGPGARSIPHVLRLQEMEKAFLMATHKSLDPPVNAPASMEGHLSTLPGARNFYRNAQETVTSMYDVRFDFNGVGAAVERVEQRIKEIFFNDLFLQNRDPNASPLKARQVDATEMEKLFGLGPVVDRMGREVFEPTIERCFNIMLRQNRFPEVPRDFAGLLDRGGYRINMTSPLATAQRAAALQGVNSFLQFAGFAAQYDPTVMDNIDTDATVREYADITGVRHPVLRNQNDVKAVRKQRADQQQQRQEMEQQMIATQMQGEQAESAATVQEKKSKAQLNMIAAQEKIGNL